MNVGKTLKRLREERNLTQREVATALKIGISSLSEYENNPSMPSLSKFLSLVHYDNIEAFPLMQSNREYVDITDLSPVSKQKIQEILLKDKK